MPQEVFPQNMMMLELENLLTSPFYELLVYVNAQQGGWLEVGCNCQGEMTLIAPNVHAALVDEPSFLKHLQAVPSAKSCRRHADPSLRFPLTKIEVHHWKAQSGNALMAWRSRKVSLLFCAPLF